MTQFDTLAIEEVTNTLIDYRGKTPPKTKSGVRLVTAKIIKDGFVQNDKSEYISEETYDVWMRRGYPRQYDILITTEAPLGQVAQLRLPERVALAQRVILLRGEPSVIDQQYFFQALKSPIVQNGLQARASGTTVLGIKQSELRKVRIPCPSLPTQHRIASILSAYDDLIENNTRRIQILEEMAQRIYKEWFVDFRFPGHEKVKFVDSELGRIPSGWEIKTIEQVCSKLVDGDWIETKDQGGSDYRLLQVSNIGLGCFRETGNFRFINEETFIRLRCTEILPGDILISRMPKPTGRAWLVTKMPWRMITAVDVAIAKADVKLVSPLYLFNHLNSQSTLDLVEKHQTGTTRPRISRKALGGLPIMVPPIELQDLYEKFAHNSYMWGALLHQKNTNLRQTRDLLLPKLISGEIDVSDMPEPKEAAAA